MCSAGLKVRNFQIRTEPIRLFSILNFPSNRQRRIGGVEQSTVAGLPAETRITYDTLLHAGFFCF